MRRSCWLYLVSPPNSEDPPVCAKWDRTHSSLQDIWTAVGDPRFVSLVWDWLAWLRISIAVHRTVGAVESVIIGSQRGFYRWRTPIIRPRRPILVRIGCVCGRMCEVSERWRGIYCDSRNASTVWRQATSKLRCSFKSSERDYIFSKNTRITHCWARVDLQASVWVLGVPRAEWLLHKSCHHNDPPLECIVKQFYSIHNLALCLIFLP